MILDLLGTSLAKDYDSPLAGGVSEILNEPTSFFGASVIAFFGVGRVLV